MAVVINGELVSDREARQRMKKPDGKKSKSLTWSKFHFIQPRTYHLFEWVVLEDKGEICIVEIINQYIDNRWEKSVLEMSIKEIKIDK